MKALPLCLIATVITSLFTAYTIDTRTTCTVVYFINSIAIGVNTSYRGILYLETPVNFSSLNLNQTVKVVTSRGTAYGSESGYAVEVIPGNPLYAYVVVEVRTCSPDFSTSLTVMREVLMDPVKILQELQGVGYYASNMTAEFLGRPPQVVEIDVRSDFEKWLRNFNWYYLVENISMYPLLVSVYAARFIYVSGYIKYEASLLPRSLEDLIESKEGDCDDMSRLLVALLWSYGVPAVIVHGYVVISDFSMRSTLGTFEYFFDEGGPHAFVLAYTPEYGWLSLDLLAGSLLTQPFVLWGITKGIKVGQEEIKEVEELHKSLEGCQFMTVMYPGDPNLESTTSLELFINSSLCLTQLASRTQVPGNQTVKTQTLADSATIPGGLKLPFSVIFALSALVLVIIIIVIIAFSKSAVLTGSRPRPGAL